MEKNKRIIIQGSFMFRFVIADLLNDFKRDNNKLI